jgi:hypothetical protein
MGHPPAMRSLFSDTKLNFMVMSENGQHCL